MKKQQQNQQLIQLKTLIDSSDDDVDVDVDVTSTSTTSNETDQSSKITHLMRENERKIRSLSESYMNRFLFIGQQLQSLPQITPNVPLSSTIRSIEQNLPIGTVSNTVATLSPSLTAFIETLKQLIVKEERKREKCYLPSYDDNHNSSDLYTRLSNGITQCLRDYEAEMNHAKRRINDLNEQQEHGINENKHVVAQLTEAFEQNTVTLRQTYEKHLAKQREESLHIAHALDKYKVEILTLRDSYEKKLRAKDELVNDLNERLVKNEAEQATRHHALHLKIEQFQQSFETLQARNKQIEQNNQIKTKENHDLLAQISNLQIQIQRLQQTITSKANECSELSQKLASLLPKVSECERYESELNQWFSLISPENNSTDLTLDSMATVVASKLSQFENSRRQLDAIREELDTAQISEGRHLSDRIRYLITQNQQIDSSHHEINNKYQALLLQVNMLTGIIKQHSTEIANHKTNEEQLKDFNEQLLNENQKIKLEIQEYRSKYLQIVNTNNQLEHECNLNKQHAKDMQIQYETFKSENQMLTHELQNKREAIKRYEQERQLFQTENDSLKQLVLRDSQDKQPTQLKTIQYLTKKYVEKDTIDDEIYRISNGYPHEHDHRILPLNDPIENDISEGIISRRATSTPTYTETDNQHIQPLGITKQINQVLNDMKSLLTYSRETIIKHDESFVVPERDFKVRKRSKIRQVRKERATVIGIEQH